MDLTPGASVLVRARVFRSGRGWVILNLVGPRGTLTRATVAPEALLAVAPPPAPGGPPPSPAGAGGPSGPPAG